jgi:hypothetical protein
MYGSVFLLKSNLMTAPVSRLYKVLMRASNLIKALYKVTIHRSNLRTDVSEIMNRLSDLGLD